MRLIQRFDRDWQGETFYDHAAKPLEPVEDVVLSGIKGRIDSQEMPTVLRVIGDVGTGKFDGFEAPIAGEEHTSDKALTIRALDLTKAGPDSILGQQLNLIELLPSGLKNVSAAISMGNFESVANALARDDAKNSLTIALDLYGQALDLWRRRRTKRAKAQPALILAGHGISLRVENGALTIQNGFTHYPQQPEIIRYFREGALYPLLR